MSRDSNGNYSLPVGNPVIPGTPIESAWANSTMQDIAAALTDSLSRSGAGGMLVPFENQDGTLANPGITWEAMPTSGIFRDASGMGFVWSGSEKFRVGPSGATINGAPLVPANGFPDGTAALPGIAWAAMQNSGFTRDAGGMYAVWNGAAIMVWNAGGTYIGGSPVISEATLIGQPRTFTAPQRAQAVTQPQGYCDMLAANDFIINVGGAFEFGFYNVTAGQRGMIWLNNSGGYAITTAAGILAPESFEADVSTVGLYLVSYWAVSDTAVAVSYTGPCV